MDPEGDTYQYLYEHHVPNISRCLVHCNVLNHRTRTADHLAASWNRHGKAHLVPHVHHRLVLDDVGRPIYNFYSTREFFGAILDAI